MLASHPERDSITGAAASITAPVVGAPIDPDGNLIGDGTKSYTWNARDQLTGIAGAVSASFAYDGVGRRRAKTISGATTQFLYDGLNPVQELAGGTPTANLLTGLGIDEYLTRTDGGGTRHFLTDALGSTAALADAAGTVQTSYTYEPFGGFATSGAATGNPFAFTGREADGTALYFYRARYYDPRLQRFIAEDPIGFAAGDANLHRYVFSDPVGLQDPLGEFPMRMPPACSPGNPASRKFRVPFEPVVRFLFGDPCDPTNMMPTTTPLAAPAGPLAGPLRRLAAPLRRLAPLLGPMGPIFGRPRYRGGTPGWLNRGPVRLGWYWHPSGINKFGLHWGRPGDVRGFPYRYHIPFGPTAGDPR